MGPDRKPRRTKYLDCYTVISTALAVLFTLFDSGIDVLWNIDSFDCSKLLNRVQPITQTRPDQTRGKEENRKKEKKREKEKEKREGIKKKEEKKRKKRKERKG